MSEEHTTGETGKENILANFLREYYGTLIGVECEGSNKIQTPYIVAYHHFNLFHTQLKKWTDLFFSVAKKYPAVKFAVGELDVFKNSAKYTPSVHDASKKPLLYVVNQHKNKSKFRNTYDFKGLSEFCDEILDNVELESEPLPEATNSCVKTAVALNFIELVENNPKDVFIMFYKPWCYACKPILPRLNKLAGILHSNGDSKHIVVVRMNIDANCIPDKRFSRSLTPQFYLKRADKNGYIAFWSSDWTVENMLKFLAKHATKELRRYNRNGEEWNRKERRKLKNTENK